MAKTSLIKELREHVHADSIGKRRDGNIVLRQGFFYSHGRTAEGFAAKVTKALEACSLPGSVIDSGEVWKSFRGGASVANSSHFYVVVAPVAKGQVA